MEHAKEALPEGSNFVTSGGHKSPAVATAGEIMLNFAQRTVDSESRNLLRHGNMIGHARLPWCCFTAQLADQQLKVYINVLFSYSIYTMIVKMIRTVRLCLCLCWLLLTLHTGVRPSHNDFCAVWHWKAVLTSSPLLKGESFIESKYKRAFLITAGLAVTLLELTQVWCGSLVKLLVKHIRHRLL